MGVGGRKTTETITSYQGGEILVTVDVDLDHVAEVVRLSFSTLYSLERGGREENLCPSSGYWLGSHKLD